MLRKKQNNDAETVRQRKQKSKKNKDDDDHVEPLDEDDQARMIQQLRSENAQQQASIEQVFGYLCTVAGVVLILSVFYLDQWHMASSSAVAQRAENYLALLRTLSVAHGVSSAFLHSTSSRVTRPRQVVGVTFRLAAAVDAAVAVFVLWACRRVGDETLLWMHYGIVASNVLVVLAAILLRLDAASTDKAFQDLIHAQYRYKTL